MKNSSMARQAGISFIGLVVVIAVLAGAGVLVAQAVPTMIEFQAVVKAIEKSKDAGSPAEVRVAFEKAAQIDDIKSVGPKDLEITRANDRNVVKVAYNKEIHMFGPAYLMLKYAHTTK
ncbi:DUF4845 domain-containing protein [Ramlibacter tataouinensis]|uniref:DUF4845 domain-containing protein n=1 Tax=Ramlibacter tataouinensis TaxID=94132 RepID=UPI0022F39F32|nr:DUF4845 domain-containing protein [Ramlibacter tataouinensis]WBY00886.1 DUF4845 domain-containing protein [Ramlibacter tataouinensis]